MIELIAQSRLEAAPTDYLSFHAASASGPNSTFTEVDISNFGIFAQAVILGPSDSTIESAVLTTDQAGELVTGQIVVAGGFDTKIGVVEFDVSFDVGASIWKSCPATSLPVPVPVV